MLHHNEFSTFMRGYILHALNFLQECSSYTLKVVRGKFFLWTCETAITPYYKITLNPDDEKTPKNCQILILGCKWASVPCTWRFRSMKRHISCHEKKNPTEKTNTHIKPHGRTHGYYFLVQANISDDFRWPRTKTLDTEKSPLLCH